MLWVWVPISESCWSQELVRKVDDCSLFFGGGIKMFRICYNFTFTLWVLFLSFNEVFKSFCGRWVVWFDLWLGPHKIAFCWNIDELREPTVSPWDLAIWQSEILRQMKSVTFEQSSANVWEEKKKKKRRTHLLFLLRSRLPPTPSLESLPQIAFTQAFITQLKLSYCSWHSEQATTSAKQFILGFSSMRIYGKVGNCSIDDINGHVLFECGQKVEHSEELERLGDFMFKRSFCEKYCMLILFMFTETPRYVKSFILLGTFPLGAAVHRIYKVFFLVDSPAYF